MACVWLMTRHIATAYGAEAPCTLGAVGYGLLSVGMTELTLLHGDVARPESLH